jgi:hypothetical protein
VSTIKRRRGGLNNLNDTSQSYMADCGERMRRAVAGWNACQLGFAVACCVSEAGGVNVR